MTTPSPLYLALFSLHGLVRGHDLELGRDADTGGQVKYLLELAIALAEHPQVERVDLITRLVEDPNCHPDYAAPLESLGPKARIVRIPCGPRRYLRKESLWPHLPSLADHTLNHFRSVGRLPDILHSHYADAGVVVARLAGVLGVPHIHTGHSLGREKQRQLAAKGVSPETMERRYQISRRIEAEEVALGSASLVVASSTQEVEEQYARYEHYSPRRMKVIPPGVDLSRFHPPAFGFFQPRIRESLNRFLREPEKPMILAVARPDEKKNLATLVRAYGEHPRLRERANLVIVAGNRESIRAMEARPREVLGDLLLLMDDYDLYGHMAFPRHHTPEDVPELFRLAAKRQGVFVNPAFTEPFGLTLLEAAASGLPVVATSDGGPREILANCRNGLLIDPTDPTALGEALEEALSHRPQWRRWARQGLSGVRRHYSWSGHVATYVDEVNRLLAIKLRPRRAIPPALEPSRLTTVDRLLVTDLDNTLLGDREGLARLLPLLERHRDRVGFGIATGRVLKSALRVLQEWKVPTPDFLITGVGSAIHYRPNISEDESWREHIAFRWEPEAVLRTLAAVPGIRLQSRDQQGEFKISYDVDPTGWPGLKALVRRLRQANLHVRPIYSHDAYLDILPMRASKGLALSHLAFKWGIPLERCLVSGDSGNDLEMMEGNTLAVLVGNHSPEMDHLRGSPRIYVAEAGYAAGIVEGMAHYDFLGQPAHHPEPEPPPRR